MGSEVRALDTDPPSGVRPVVLVVDDEPGVRESFHLILDDDYEVIDVPDGAAALGVLRGTHVDLVLLDIRLPGMDGIEVLERIKATDEGMEVILVTAVKTVRTAVAAMKLGAFDYVTKPFDEDELLVLVAGALERARRSSARCATCARELDAAPRLRRASSASAARCRRSTGSIAQVAPDQRRPC